MEVKYLDKAVPVELYRITAYVDGGGMLSVYSLTDPKEVKSRILGDSIEGTVKATVGHYFERDTLDGDSLVERSQLKSISGVTLPSTFKYVIAAEGPRYMVISKLSATYNAATGSLVVVE